MRIGWTVRLRARVARRFALLVGAVCVSSTPTQAQSDSLGATIPLVADFVYDGQVSEWRARPLDRVLEAVGGRPQALVWIGQVDDGLVVAAELRGEPESLAATALAIALAGSEEPEFPPIGWGHQFGFEVLSDSASCVGSELDFAEEACFEWLTEQQAHRDRIKPLFERKWWLYPQDPGSLTEVLATPAFDDLADGGGVAALAPRGQPGALTRAIEGTGGGIGLEVLIPWSAFPAVRAPDLAAVRIGVEWADSNATGGASRVGLTGLPRPLASPIHHTTPCESGFAGLLIPREGSAPRRASPDAVPYMIPDASGDLRELIVLDNHARGYQYTPERETRSPQAFESRFSVLDLGDGGRLCAPTLALSNEEGRVSPDDWTHTGVGDPPVGYLDFEHVEVRRQEDGNLLVLIGPRVWSSYYGSGQCGACPRVGVEILHVEMATGEVRPALRYFNMAEPGTNDVEIEVSSDWREVRTYTSAITDFETDPLEIRWSAERYCILETENPTYEKCGEDDNVPEPPALLRPLYRDWQSLTGPFGSDGGS